MLPYCTVQYLAWVRGVHGVEYYLTLLRTYDTRNTRSRARVGEPMLRQTRITQHCWPGESCRTYPTIVITVLPVPCSAFATQYEGTVPTYLE